MQRPGRVSRDETMSQLPPGSQRSETLTLSYRFLKFHSPSRDIRLWKSGPRSPRRPGENKFPTRLTWGSGGRALVPGVCARGALRRGLETRERAPSTWPGPRAATHTTRPSRGLSPAPSPAEAGAGASLWPVTRRSWSHNYERLGFCC